MAPKAERKRRFARINMRVQATWWADKEQGNNTHTEGAVMSLSTLDLKTPLVWYIATLVIS